MLYTGNMTDDLVLSGLCLFICLSSHSQVSGRQVWIQILALSLLSCVTLDKSINTYDTCSLNGYNYYNLLDIFVIIMEIICGME
jgi:hypothetical protein